MNIRRATFIFFVACFVWRSSPALSEDFAYVLKFQPPEPDCLVRFDVNNNKTLKEIKLPKDKAFNNFVVDEKGGCYISNFRGDERYFRDIYYYDAEKDMIEKFFDLGDKFGPSTLFLTDKELIVKIKGNDKTHNHGGIIFIDRKTKQITGSVFLQEDNPYYVQADIDQIFFDGNKYLFVSSFYLCNENEMSKFLKTEYTGDVYVIDIEKKKIIKIIKVDRKYKDIVGVCNAGDKIYVAAGEWGERNSVELLPPNNRILVYSFKTGELIKTIKVDYRPYQLIYDRSVSKLYVTHRDDTIIHDKVEVIDVKTDRIIRRIKIPSRLMFSMVTPGRMYISVGKGFLQDSYAEPRLLVLDTKTDKIIKEFPGVYTGISLNSKY